MSTCVLLFLFRCMILFLGLLLCLHFLSHFERLYKYIKTDLGFYILAILVVSVALIASSILLRMFLMLFSIIKLIILKI